MNIIGGVSRERVTTCILPFDVNRKDPKIDSFIRILLEAQKTSSDSTHQKPQPNKWGVSEAIPKKNPRTNQHRYSPILEQDISVDFAVED